MFSLNGQSEITKIESVLVKHLRDAWLNQEHIDFWWRKLNYPECPDFKKAEAEYEHFIGLLQELIPAVYELPRSEKVSPDSLYPRDPVVITKKGAILLNMGKQQRRSEAEAIGAYLKNGDPHPGVDHPRERWKAVTFSGLMKNRGRVVGLPD